MYVWRTYCKHSSCDTVGYGGDRSKREGVNGDVRGDGPSEFFLPLQVALSAAACCECPNSGVHVRWFRLEAVRAYGHQASSGSDSLKHSLVRV